MGHPSNSVFEQRASPSHFCPRENISVSVMDGRSSVKKENDCFSAQTPLTYSLFTFFKDTLSDIRVNEIYIEALATFAIFEETSWMTFQAIKVLHSLPTNRIEMRFFCKLWTRKQSFYLFHTGEKKQKKLRFSLYIYKYQLGTAWLFTLLLDVI